MNKGIPKPLEATFLFDGHHFITVMYYRDGKNCLPSGKPKCETCSLPYVIAEAAKLALRNGIRSMTLDGATLVRSK